MTYTETTRLYWLESQRAERAGADAKLAALTEQENAS